MELLDILPRVIGDKGHSDDGLRTSLDFPERFILGRLQTVTRDCYVIVSVVTNDTDSPDKKLNSIGIGQLVICVRAPRVSVFVPSNKQTAREIMALYKRLCGNTKRIDKKYRQVFRNWSSINDYILAASKILSCLKSPGSFITISILFSLLHHSDDKYGDCIPRISRFFTNFQIFIKSPPCS